MEEGDSEHAGVISLAGSGSNLVRPNRRTAAAGEDGVCGEDEEDGELRLFTVWEGDSR
jgi:hypothetical protein